MLKKLNTLSLGAAVFLSACSGSELGSSSRSISTSNQSSAPKTSGGQSSIGQTASSLASETPASRPNSISESAIQIIQTQCTSCHFGLHKSWQAYATDDAWKAAQTTSGISYINPLDPDNSLLLTRIKGYGGANSDMPLANAAQSTPFTKTDFETLRTWVRSFAKKPTAPVSDGTITITDTQFDETGLAFSLLCTNPTDTFSVNVQDPNTSKSSPVSDYAAMTARASGVAEAEFSQLVTVASDGTFNLKGEGIDIWTTHVYFNGLRAPVTAGELDMTLDVLDVKGVEHDFAKVGLLVTDEKQLAGKMVFVHWSGRRGLAEDSGEGALTIYRNIARSPYELASAGASSSAAPLAPTPTPARLRVTYENNTLKVGGCLGCEMPAVGLPKLLNFEPKYVFVVASSHTLGTIQARLSLKNAYASANTFSTLHTASGQCTQGKATVMIPKTAVGELNLATVNVFRNNTLVASSPVAKTFSAAASCEEQTQLLDPKLRRLSEVQIKNAIIDIFGDIFDNSLWPNMEDGAKLIGMNTTADKLNINNLNFERWVASSRAITDTILSQHATIKACTQSADDTCVVSLAAQYGRRLWRRTLTIGERTELNRALANFSDNRSKLSFALNSFMLSADFLFRSEIGKLSNGINTLTNDEIVSVLSFAVLNTTPDDALLTLAASSTPITREQLTQQINRLFTSPRATNALMEVYKDYLKLDLVLSRPKDASFAFTDTVRSDVLTSAERQLSDSIAVNPRFTDVFLGDEFYVNKNIAYLFSAPSTSSTLQKTTLNSAERQGVLNHPAFLAVHSTLTQSGIVKRGVFTLEQLLCQDLPDPPGDVMPVPIPAGIDPQTTSERDLLQITHSSQAACFGCHQVIDPAGFGFENFDAIGRYRTTEKTNVPIDASGELDSVGAHVLSYTTSAEYAEALVGSPQMQECVAHRFLENFLGQDLAHNSCELQKYRVLLDGSEGTVKDLLLSLVQLESFSKRQLGQ